MQPQKSLIIGLCSVLISLGQVSSASAGFRDQPEVQTSVGISYLSGGIGEEERDTLAQLDQDYNLKLIFADTTGHYLSDVTVGITDERDHQVLTAVSHGPWFFANLPAGRYHVLASIQGYTREQVVQVSPQRQARLAFAWPEQGSHFARAE
jgi:hypothetical protein